MASGSDTNITVTTTSTGGTLTSPPLQAPPPPLPTLSFDLIEEILCRLPVKLLLQFRCLSKYFNSLISDPYFAKKHLRLSTKRHHLMLTSGKTRGELVFFDSPIASDFSTSTLAPAQLSYPNCFKFEYRDSCSCDGIFCYTMRSGSSTAAILWNPSLRKFKILPPLDIKAPISTYTFGFDKFINNYKVVAMSLFRDKCEVRVLTLGMDSWRRIQDFPYSGLYCGLGIFVGGTVNWLPFDVVSSFHVIVSLDLEKESYQKIPHPDLENGLWTFLGSLKDCLCIYACSDDMLIDVWIMKEYGNKASWTKLYCVPHMGIWGIGEYINNLCISENDQLLMTSHELGTSKKLVVHDSKNGTFMIPEIQNLNSWMVTRVYIESLISPCS